MDFKSCRQHAFAERSDSLAIFTAIRRASSRVRLPLCRWENLCKLIYAYTNQLLCLLRSTRPHRERPPNKLLRPGPHLRCNLLSFRRSRSAGLRCLRNPPALVSPDRLLLLADPGRLLVLVNPDRLFLLFGRVVPPDPAVLVGPNRQRVGKSQAPLFRVPSSLVPPLPALDSDLAMWSIFTAGLAMFAAMLRASSLLSNLAATPAHLQNRHRQAGARYCPER